MSRSETFSVPSGIMEDDYNEANMVTNIEDQILFQKNIIPPKLHLY